MKRYWSILRPLMVWIVFSSCSFNKLAVNTSSDLIYKLSNQIEAESNYETFKSGIPANLILLEGLLSESPENMDILTALTKGHAGYAFAVNETEMQNEEWGELKNETGKAQALLNYTRALNFGLRYLKLYNIELNELISLTNESQGIEKLLDKKINPDKRNLELVLFTAQSFAGLVNLQKDNMSMVAQLPVAKAMFDWVCAKNSKINFGACGIFYGAFEAGRPKMLGGNPEKGKEIFLQTIATHPHNWLVRTSFIQYYLIPQNDKQGFDEQLEFLKNTYTEFQNFHIYSSNSKISSKDQGWSLNSHLRFYQSLALKRFELINKYQKQFF